MLTDNPTTIEVNVCLYIEIYVKVTTERWMPINIPYRAVATQTTRKGPLMFNCTSNDNENNATKKDK